MDDTSYWDNRRNNITSQVGRWEGGVDVIIEGSSLMNELIGNISWMQLLVLNATGKRVEKNISDWIEALWMCLSYPDSRIWCNQLAALSADVKNSPASSISAGIMGADSYAYGGSKTRGLAMTALIRMYARYKGTSSLADSILGEPHRDGKPMIIGFARPIDKKDERIEPLSKLQEKLDIPRGSYIQFALSLGEFLDTEWGYGINVGGYGAAFFLDQGFTPEEGHRLGAFSTASGELACQRDFVHRPTNSYLPLKCEDIEYTGPRIRNF